MTLTRTHNYFNWWGFKEMFTAILKRAMSHQNMSEPVKTCHLSLLRHQSRVWNLSHLCVRLVISCTKIGGCRVVTHTFCWFRFQQKSRWFQNPFRFWNRNRASLMTMTMACRQVFTWHCSPGILTLYCCGEHITHRLIYNSPTKINKKCVTIICKPCWCEPSWPCLEKVESTLS